MKKKGEKIGDLIKKSESESPAIQNTQTQPDVLYEVSLENTLTNLKEKEKGFFKIREDINGQRYWNGLPVDILGDSRIEIEGENFNITPNLQKVFTDTTDKSLIKLNKKENQTYRKLLNTLNYENYRPKYGKVNSGRYKYTKNILKPINLQGRGIEKIIIPSNVNDIYTRLEILLGLNLSGHADTLTEASNLIDEIYKRGEIQNKQQYRNDLNKFSTN